MKASELVAALTEAMERDGDLIVCIPGLDGAGWNQVRGVLQTEPLTATPRSIVHDYADAKSVEDHIHAFTLY